MKQASPQRNRLDGDGSGLGGAHDHPEGSYPVSGASASGLRSSGEEHFSPKEGVAGSIPAGGAAPSSAYGVVRT